MVIIVQLESLRWGTSTNSISCCPSFRPVRLLTPLQLQYRRITSSYLLRKAYSYEGTVLRHKGIRVLASPLDAVIFGGDMCGILGLLSFESTYWVTDITLPHSNLAGD